MPENMNQLHSSMNSSLSVEKGSAVVPVAGVKRPAPSLLPAFEPFSSSPPLPRPVKRQARASPSKHGLEKYPTPIPTSSTGIIPSSSPPRISRRPALQRTLSTFSERAPLSAVPTIELDEHSQPTLMGRSSNSSHYQLSTNKLISRVHVRATFFPMKCSGPKRVLVECVGWNGVKVHCQGRVWDLRKGDSFTSETGDADIMVDVHDARVLLQWPRQHENKISTPTDSDHSENSPRQIHAAARRTPNQSPLRQQHMHSPVSPSPAVQAAHPTSSTLFTSDPGPAPVQVYEDDPSDEIQPTQTEATQSTQQISQPLGLSLNESPSCEPLESKDFSDNDEENDPIVHCFGPYGSNINRRMESFTTGSSPPRRPLNTLKEASISPQRRHSSEFTNEGEHHTPIVNHVINQLAYSQRSSTPLSILMDHLPAHLKQDSPGSKENIRLTVESFIKMLDATPCIGEVSREGKDAAGKPLESEYYYVPDMDTEEKRRNAVVEGLRKPGLRACRKQHKVCVSVLVGRALKARVNSAKKMSSNTSGENRNKAASCEAVLENWSRIRLLPYCNGGMFHRKEYLFAS